MVYRKAPEKEIVKVDLKLSLQQVINAVVAYARKNPDFSDNIPEKCEVRFHVQNGVRADHFATISYEAERPKGE